MGQNPLRNIGSNDIEKFLIAHNCIAGKTHGDDKIYYYSINRNIGIKVRINSKIKKSGYPIGTLNYNINCLNKASKGAVNKVAWIKWFGEKRDIKGTGENRKDRK